MAEVVCGYYGKLPVSPEFLRLHASGPELRWLDEWLQQGMLSAKAQEGTAWAERMEQAGPYGFFYVPSHGGRIACGAIVASQDKAGRAFPFLSYALVEQGDFASQPWLIPVATATYIRDTTDAVRTLREEQNWEAFRRTMEDRTVQEPDAVYAMETFDRFTHTTTVGQWCFGETPLGGEATQLVMEQLFTRVMHVRGQGQQGVRFPIGQDGIPGNLDLAFWLQLYLQPYVGGAQAQTGVLCFWRRDPSRGTALLSIGPGSPNVVRFLLNPEAQDDAWSDMTAPIPDLVLEQAEETTQPSTVDRQDSLTTVAQRMGHHLGRARASPDRMGSESARLGLWTRAVQ